MSANSHPEEKMKLQEKQVRKALAEDIEPLIDISDVQKHNGNDIQQFRTTRALAALSFAGHGKVDIGDAVSAITDGSGDNGIDLIGYSLSQRTLYLIQSKAKHGVSPTEIMKFTNGIRDLLEDDFESFNARIRDRRTEIEEYLDFRDLKVCAIFTHLGDQKPNTESKRLIKKFEEEVNSSGEILEFHVDSLKENHDLKDIARGKGEISADLRFYQWCTLEQWQYEILGVVSAAEIANIVEQFGDRLFDENIRKGLANSEVNAGMIETLRKAPQNFWHYNNGITIVSEEINTRGKPSSKAQDFTLTNFSVVNGAQTCTSIFQASRDDSIDLSDAFVTVRVISVNGRDGNFGTQVTKFTNSQNRVGKREFVALDPLQQEIKTLLDEEGIQYAFRSGEAEDKEHYNEFIELEDATKALACKLSIGDCARVKNRISAYWEDVKQAPYTSIFNEKIKEDPQILVNAVRTYRAVDTLIAVHSKEMDKAKKKPYGQITNFVAALVFNAMMNSKVNFKTLEPTVTEWIKENEDSLIGFIDFVVKKYLELNPNGYPQAFFKNQDKVAELEKKTGQFSGKQAAKK